MTSDPMLGPLADQGRLVATLALHPRSSRVDAGAIVLALQYVSRRPAFNGDIGTRWTLDPIRGKKKMTSCSTTVWSERPLLRSRRHCTKLVRNDAQRKVRNPDCFAAVF